MASNSEQHNLHGITERLVGEFDGVLPPQQVAAELRKTLRQYDDAPVKMFVPVIAEREARERLRDLLRHSA